MTDKLKIVLDDLRTRVRITESKIDLHNSMIEGQKNEILKLNDKKDSTDNLKQNYLQFTESFNNTVKNLFVQIDTNKNDTKELLALQDEKRNDLKNDLDKKIQELNSKIEVLNKMLDF